MSLLLWLVTALSFPIGGTARACQPVVVGVDLSKGWKVFGSSGAVVFALLSGLALLSLLGRC